MRLIKKEDPTHAQGLRINGRDYDYLEVIDLANGDQYFKVYNVKGDLSLLNDSIDYIFLKDTNWDMIWTCDFVRVYKNRNVILRKI